jgi:putative transposase
MLASVEHRQSKYFQQPGREFPSTRPTAGAGDETLHLSRARATLLSAFSGISPHFRPRRHLLTTVEWRTEMADRFVVWREITATDAAWN